MSDSKLMVVTFEFILERKQQLDAKVKSGLAIYKKNIKRL